MNPEEVARANFKRVGLAAMIDLKLGKAGAEAVVRAHAAEAEMRIG